MNKAELSAKWGKYCDTNTLVDDVMELLTTYRHRNTVHGVCTLLDKFFTNKESLIKLFASSNHYIGNLRIKTTQSFDRQINRSEISRFFTTHRGEFMVQKPLMRVDDKGCAQMDYMKADTKFVDLSSLVDNAALKEMVENLRKFTDNGITMESYNFNNQVQQYWYFFQEQCCSNIRQDLAPRYDSKAPSFKAGMKTSRAFNAYCHYYGLDKKETYNKSFAQYADLVSALKRNMDYVISLNPLDYLTMSNGVSWHSCHRLNGGGWKGGCLSYMLDKTSIITYVVEDIKSNAKIHLIPKYYRQMIHYDDGMFMQNRLYPQENDGAVDLYDKFRGFLKEEFNEILNNDGEWDVEGGSTACVDHARSTGAHYVDYTHNNRCNIFYPHAKATDMRSKILRIGHEGICTYCGCKFTDCGMIAHSTCTCSNT